jgi:hypothetical protein
MGDTINQEPSDGVGPDRAARLHRVELPGTRLTTWREVLLRDPSVVTP